MVVVFALGSDRKDVDRVLAFNLAERNTAGVTQRDEAFPQQGTLRHRTLIWRKRSTPDRHRCRTKDSARTHVWLKAKAREQGVWNPFLPPHPGDTRTTTGLTNLEYAPLCEIMGRRYRCSETFNGSAPDTGNMEVLARYGTKAQQERWLTPLLAGEIRSAFAMTEPDVASSDATNIECSIRRQGDEYVINGRK